MEHELAGLIEAARQARKHSYAPYSKFTVGAALLCDDGTVFTGVNIENAAYSESLCAERAAIANAVTEGRRDFKAMAIVCGGEEPCYPCGSCRQVLTEFNPQIKVIMASHDGIKLLEMTVDQLLPHAFSPDRLKEGQKPEPPEAPGPRPWP